MWTLNEWFLQTLVIQAHYETRLFPEAFHWLSLAVSSCTVIDPSAAFSMIQFSHPVQAQGWTTVAVRPDLHLNQIPILSLERERRGWDYSTVCPWFSQGCVVIHMAYSCRSGLWSRLIDRDRGSVYMPGTHICLYVILSCPWCF